MTCVLEDTTYQEVWVPVIDKTLSCCREVGNPHDPFAVKVIKAGTTVGHLPKKNQLYFFSVHVGWWVKVTNPHLRYSSDLVQGGLEIPCIVTLQGTKELIDKARKLLTISSKIDITATDKKPSSKEVAAIASAPNAKRIKLEKDVD